MFISSTAAAGAAGDSVQVGTWVDAFTQWLVSAPIAAQMLFMLVCIVPLAVVGAWLLMAIVDRTGLAIERRAASRGERRIEASGARGSKMDDHVESQS